MKTFSKLMALAIVAVFTSVTVAQVSPDTSKKITASNTTAVAEDSEYVFMQNNKMMLHWFESDVTLGAVYPCNDGSKVSLTGLVTRTDGSTIQLKNGDKVFADGKYESIDSSSTMKD